MNYSILHEVDAIDKHGAMLDSLIGAILVAEGVRPAAWTQLSDEDKRWPKFMGLYQTVKDHYGNIDHISYVDGILIYRKNTEIGEQIRKGEFTIKDMGILLGFQCGTHDIFKRDNDHFFIQYTIRRDNQENMNIYAENCELEKLPIQEALDRVFKDVDAFNSVMGKFGYFVNFIIESKLHDDREREEEYSEPEEYPEEYPEESSEPDFESYNY